MLNLDGGDYRAIKAILDAEHQKWKDERESSKTWGKRETRKERIKRRRDEQERRKKLKHVSRPGYFHEHEQYRDAIRRSHCRRTPTRTGSQARSPCCNPSPDSPRDCAPRCSDAGCRPVERDLRHSSEHAGDTRDLCGASREQ